MTDFTNLSEDEIKDFLTQKTARECACLLETAACDNDTKSITAILENTKVNCDRALFYAASQGHMDAVQLLLPRADPKANNSEALRIACQFGLLDIVKILLPVSDPQSNNNHPLRVAAGHGHVEVVRYILPFTNPKDVNSAALLAAAYNQHWEIADMLFDASDVDKVRQNLEQSGPGPWQNFENEVHARRQKIRIEDEVSTVKSASRSKKI